MPLHRSQGIKFFSFSNLASAGVKHAAISRLGGVSPYPWASLNVGGTVGDDAERVFENRKRAFSTIECEMDSLFDVWQVHSSSVVVAEAPRPPGQVHVQADGILTGRPGITLFMRFADCVPVFLFDPVKRVIGLAHAGWLGTVRRTVGVAIETMVAKFDSQPEDVIAGIGPSIAAHHYPIGQDVASQVRQVFGDDANRFLIPASSDGGDSKVQFDLWEANRLILSQAGVRQIEVSNICTACHVEDWYSHRGENGKTGRFGALISLDG